ncbi:MAG: putative electron transfer oxidoreductase [Verrucomicrobiales bacterium]|nr:putative electron transfer oxidoreductase [Verrucomicrobiales bacterium]
MTSASQAGITIIGGGLAGLSLGILLRQAQIPVLVHEAGCYPRNKVCGEFISGAGQSLINQIGILPRLKGKAMEVKTVAIFSATDCLQSSTLPVPALAISRLDLDFQMALQFQDLQGELKTGSRFTGQRGNPGIVFATGRRPQTYSGEFRYFGLKAHFSELELASDLELHFGHEGYVGLLRLPGGMVNVCGLFRARDALPDLSQTWKERLSGKKGSPLSRRMASAKEVDSSFCSVAALGVGTFFPQFNPSEFSVGDSMLMIPPFTGNGMSIAFETAALALPHLVNYLKSGNWENARLNLYNSYRSLLNSRMRAAYAVQWMMFQPGLQALLLKLLKRRPSLLNTIFRLTR